jgi:rhodanese-related sulfurtransferase
MRSQKNILFVSTAVAMTAFALWANGSTCWDKCSDKAAACAKSGDKCSDKAAACAKSGDKCSDKAAACGKSGCDMKKDKACATKACPVMSSAVPAINTSGLAALIRAKVPLAVLDARSGKYDDGRRLPGAKSLKADAEETEVAKLLPDKGALVVTYCAGLTCPASNMLAERLKKLGYTNVIEYPQGIEGWTKEGNSVEGGGK